MNYPTMKLRDAIEKLDRSDKNKSHANIDHFMSALDMSNYLGWDERFEEKVQMYWIQSWLCTDMMVGTAVYYMDGELIAFSHQTARRSNCEVYFVSENAAKKVRAFLATLIDEQRNDPQIISLDTEIPDYTERIVEVDRFYARQRKGNTL